MSASVRGPDARARFRDRLAAGPLLADGAMGTLLFSRGIPQRAVLDELVATRPELIGAIHREYLAVGADIIETATFGANRVRLGPYGLADQAGRLARRGAQLGREARDVSGRDALVAGSIGPLGAPSHEVLELSDASVRSTFRETIEGLLEGGIDLFWFETFPTIDHLAIAVEEARAISADVPIVALLTFGEDVALADGMAPGLAAHALGQRVEVEAVGVNCGAGPVGCLDGLTAMGGIGTVILPNAGLPQRIEGQFVYSAGPEYFGRMVGHARGRRRDCRRVLRDYARAHRRDAHGHRRTSGQEIVPDRHRASAPTITIRTEVASAADAPPPSRLARALSDGRYLISVEIDPALGPNRADDRGCAPPPGGRRRHRWRQRLGDGSRPPGEPSRSRSASSTTSISVHRPLHDRDRNLDLDLAAGSPCPRGPRHPRAHRRSATHRGVPVGDRCLGRSIRSVWSGSSTG